MTQVADLATDPRAPAGREPFALYRDGLVHAWLRTVTGIGFTLVPLFFLLDALTIPSHLLPRFGIYRGASTAFLLGLFGHLRRAKPSRWSFLYGYMIAVVVGTTITQMTVDLGGFDSRYYAGLNLVIAAINLMLPWRPLHSALNGILIIGTYLVFNALFGGPFDTKILFSNLFFMSSTVVIAVAITWVRSELIKKDFDLRQELLDANEALDGSRRELKAARDALWGEMEVAKRIQTVLLPPDRKIGGYEIAAKMFPAEEVGGDYYDIVESPGGSRWIAVGDVSGHGVEAGLVMMMTQTTILSLVRQQPDLGPAEVFRAVNGVIWENVSRLGGRRYMTLNVVRLDDAGLTLAGKHQDVLVWRAARREVEVISNEGCWIGVVPEIGPHAPDLFVPIEPGDAALFFTDGITEAMDEAGTMYGQERLIDAFARAATREAPKVLAALFEDVARYTAAQRDDMTLMLVRRTAPVRPT